MLNMYIYIYIYILYVCDTYMWCGKFDHSIIFEVWLAKWLMNNDFLVFGNAHKFYGWHQTIFFRLSTDSNNNFYLRWVNPPDQ